jgi:bacterial leucyl aminopeptidase
LEAFTILAKYSDYVPKKTIEWHVYAAEELGLLGSREIANEYKSNGAKVFAMMQLDMTGYNPSQINKIGLVTNGVDPNLNVFIRKLVNEYLKIGFVDRTLFGGSSDHASWRSAGYSACFPFEARTNPHIHTARDTIDKLDFKNGIEWVKLGVSFLVELSQ